MGKFQPNLKQVSEENTLLHELENWAYSHWCPVQDCAFCEPGTIPVYLPTLETISEDNPKTSFRQRLLSIFRKKSSTTKETTQSDVNKEKMVFVERGSGESTLIKSDRKSRKIKQVKTLPSSEKQKELIKIQDEITQIVKQNKKLHKLRRPKYLKLGKVQIQCILLKRILDIKSQPEDIGSEEPTFRQRLESRLCRYRSFYESVDEAIGESRIFRRKSSTTKEKTQTDVNKDKSHRTFKQRLVNMFCCGRKEE